MKKIIIASILSIGLGFGAGYAYMNHEASKIITGHEQTIKKLNNDNRRLNMAIEVKDEDYQALYAENRRLFEDRNAGVLFGIEACKKMKDTRSCLMELGIKTRSPIDFK
ncbi:hypothetical protein LAB19_001640 [Salmonella enterica subsp. enterica serovar Manhattan]|nr:hypothetical protein [Salmonella enterica subsp. enterica serovar Manhattan]